MSFDAISLCLLNPGSASGQKVVGKVKIITSHQSFQKLLVNESHRVRRAPSKLTFTGTSYSSDTITLSWNTPVVDSSIGQSNIVQYDLRYASLDSGVFQERNIKGFSIPMTNINISQIDTNKDYVFQIRAVDNKGLKGDWNDKFYGRSFPKVKLLSGNYLFGTRDGTTKIYKVLGSTDVVIYQNDKGFVTGIEFFGNTQYSSVQFQHAGEKDELKFDNSTEKKWSTLPDASAPLPNQSNVVIGNSVNELLEFTNSNLGSMKIGLEYSSIVYFEVTNGFLSGLNTPHNIPSLKDFFLDVSLPQTGRTITFSDLKGGVHSFVLSGKPYLEYFKDGTKLATFTLVSDGNIVTIETQDSELRTALVYPLFSNNLQYSLSLEDAGNLKIYKLKTNGERDYLVWDALNDPVITRPSHWSTPTTGGTYYFDIQLDGNLVVYGGTPTAREKIVIWDAGVYPEIVFSRKGTVNTLWLQDDGYAKYVGSDANNPILTFPRSLWSSPYTATLTSTNTYLFGQPSSSTTTKNNLSLIMDIYWDAGKVVGIRIPGDYFVDFTIDSTTLMQIYDDSSVRSIRLSTGSNSRIIKL